MYHAQGRDGEAEPLYLQAVVILFTHLGQDHPTTQTVWNNFLSFLAQVIEAGQIAPLSQHPVTQNRLQQMQDE